MLEDYRERPDTYRITVEEWDEYQVLKEEIMDLKAQLEAYKCFYNRQKSAYALLEEPSDALHSNQS